MAAEINRIYTVTDSSETFGGIDRSNGTPLGYWDKLCNMDMSRVQICDAPEDIKPCLEKTKGDICIMTLLHAENDAALMRELRKL